MNHDSSTIMEIETTKRIVGELLREDERCRNDDSYLIYCIIKRLTDMQIDYEKWKILPSFESITRCRRAFNERGVFLPTDPETIRRRQTKEREFREYYGKHDF